MDRAVESSRRRPIKSCIQCHRRKQKCDRQRPCKLCFLRQIPHQCSYDHEPVERIHSQTGNDGRELSSSSFGTTPHTSRPSDLADSIGYASSAHASEILTNFEADSSPFGRFPKSNIPLPPDIHPLARTKYLGMRAELPTRSIRLELINTYFEQCNWFFGLIEPYYFRRLQVEAETMEQGQIQDSEQMLTCWRFTALLFQTLAVALQFLPVGAPYIGTLGIDTPAARDTLSKRYSNNGIEIANLASQTSTDIICVEHHLLRAFWLKNVGCGKESWRALGHCVRSAQDVELHLETSVPKGSEDDVGHYCGRLWELEHRRRLWVKIYSWDSHMSLSLGRPRAIHPGDCSVGDPTDCDIPPDPTTMRFPTKHDGCSPPSTYTPHWFQYNISKLINQVLSSDADGHRSQDHSEALQTHSQVVAMLHKLPPAMQPHNTDFSWDFTIPALAAKRLHIAITANAFLLALHRRHSRTYALNRSLAIEAALAVLQAQHQLCETLGDVPYKAYMLSYYTIDAGLFLAASLASHPSSGPKIHQALQQALVRLAAMVQQSPLASSGLAALQTVYAKNVSIDGNGADSGSVTYSSSTTETMPTLSTDQGSSMAVNVAPEHVHDKHLLNSDPFMGLTVEDYTLEQFLTQWD